MKKLSVEVSCWGHVKGRGVNEQDAHMQSVLISKRNVCEAESVPLITDLLIKSHSVASQHNSSVSLLKWCGVCEVFFVWYYC